MAWHDRPREVARQAVDRNAFLIEKRGGAERQSSCGSRARIRRRTPAPGSPTAFFSRRASSNRTETFTVKRYRVASWVSVKPTGDAADARDFAADDAVRAFFGHLDGVVASALELDADLFREHLLHGRVRRAIEKQREWRSRGCSWEETIPGRQASIRRRCLPPAAAASVRSSRRVIMQPPHSRGALSRSRLF